MENESLYVIGLTLLASHMSNMRRKAASDAHISLLNSYAIYKRKIICRFETNNNWRKRHGYPKISRSGKRRWKRSEFVHPRHADA